MIALFGGTFNPVHNGHIQLARQVAAHFKLDNVQLLPSYLPVHRDHPGVTPRQREHMVALAVQGYPELSLNSCEIQRAGPSYTFDTLSQIKVGLPHKSLCWLMGVDAFNGFMRWKNPEGILQLANLIVCHRPGIEMDRGVLPSRLLKQAEQLSDFNAGKIAPFDMQPNSCSSTEIRRQLKCGEPVKRCLSQPVIEFIQKNKLYEN